MQLTPSRETEKPSAPRSQVKPELPDALMRFRRPIIVALHLALIPLAYGLAFLLRFDLPLPEPYADLFLRTAPLLVGIRLLVYGRYKLYNGWWRHVGIHDLADIVKATSVSTGLFIGALFLAGEHLGFPRGVIILDWGIAILWFGGVRFAVRYMREGLNARAMERRGKLTIVIGAGNAGAQLARKARHGAIPNMRVVGLVDDDRNKQDLQIHGIPVLGRLGDLPALVKKHEVKQVVLAIPSASKEERKHIVAQLMSLEVEFKVVPDMNELLDGKAQLTQLRSVQIEDLLGREPVRLDLARVERDLKGKTVLVTGGAGSIGSELARQVAMFQPARLVLLEQAESPLYFVHLELAKAHPSLEVVPVMADITDEVRLERVFSQYQPEYVFHAAAYKHVPMMEANRTEAVRNNVFGTLNVARSAVRHGCRKFVLISSDKAVNPSSVMGATKRIAERLCLGWPELRDAGTDFRAVRFGNVLGSDGSVVPLFKKQIAAGGPVTVTHPEMTRYFMTIPEAVQLVLQAAAIPEAANRISMLDMGQAVRIVDLAENLIRLSGLEPYTEMPIVFSGMRPGEKLHEELMGMLEETTPTAVEKVRVVQTDEPDTRLVEAGVGRLGEALRAADDAAILQAIRAMVPECVTPLRAAGREGGPAPVPEQRPARRADLKIVPAQAS